MSARLALAAERYRPWRALYHYSKSKMRIDPAYAETVRVLGHSPRPLLDIGCGAGQLAAYLRAHGHIAPILGVDIDERKIGIANQVLASENARFLVSDATSFPEHHGDVVMLDVLHYLEDARQIRLLHRVADSLAPEGVALIRLTLRNDSWRFQVTQWEERLIHLIGWIAAKGWNYPTREKIEGPLLEKNCRVTLRPLWGRTPFNSYLCTVTRPGGLEVLKGE